MTTTTANCILDAALDYALRGWRVVPLIPREKKPWVEEWQHTATTDEKQISAWWSKSPMGNVGVAMGPGSNLVDAETDSPEEEADLVRLFDGNVPVCPTFTSGRGKHRLLRFRADLPTKGVVAFGKLKIRVGNGDKGAQSVFPPSIHPSGKVYTWLPGCGPDDIDPPEIPDSVVKKLMETTTSVSEGNGKPEPDNRTQRTDGRTERALQSILRMRIEDGNDGSRRLFVAACRCVDCNLSDDQAVAAIRAYATVRPFPRAYSDADILKRVRDAEAKAPRVPWGGDSDEPEPIVYRSLTPGELDGEEYAVEYLIPGILAAGQHSIGGGPHKVLKTLILACDLGVSLALGGHFLGYFPVTRPARVAIMSGECGFPVLQENLRRVARAAGRELRYVGNMLISDMLPKFGHPSHIEAMGRFLEDNGIEVGILDPAYLALDGGDASNVFTMGTLLRNMADVFVQHRATMILLHHTTKPAGLDGQPIDLTNLSFAGFREFAAQWLLLNRRAPYEPGTGHHELWLSAGGRLGHSGLWAVNIDEGQYHPGVERQWAVTVSKPDEAREEARQDKENRKAEDQERREDEHRRRVSEALRRFPDGETGRTLASVSGVNYAAFGCAIRTLLGMGTAEPCRVQKGKREYDGFRPKQ